MRYRQLYPTLLSCTLRRKLNRRTVTSVSVTRAHVKNSPMASALTFYLDVTVTASRPCSATAKAASAYAADLCAWQPQSSLVAPWRCQAKFPQLCAMLNAAPTPPRPKKRSGELKRTRFGTNVAANTHRSATQRLPHWNATQECHTGMPHQAAGCTSHAAK